ncbi:MAG: pyrophosphatase PpaX [Sporolactobacillus sp.]
MCVLTMREVNEVIRTFLFDMDGTLVNTNELILSSFQYTADQFFPGRYTRSDFISFIGEPLEMSFNRLDPAQMQQMVAMYRVHNSRHHDQMVTAFPFVLETLEKLRAGGSALGVVSTKKREMVMRGLTFTGMAGLFDTIVAGDDVTHFKPDPEPVKTAMQHLQALPETTLMVGDSPADILAGSRAHVRTAAVNWSLKSSALRALRPDYWLGQMNELLQLA